MTRRRRILLALACGVGAAVAATGISLGATWPAQAGIARTKVSLDLGSDIRCADPDSLVDSPPGMTDDTGLDLQRPTFLPSKALDCTLPLIITNDADVAVTVDSIVFPSNSTFGMGIVPAGLTGAGIHHPHLTDTGWSGDTASFDDLGLVVPAGRTAELSMRIVDNGAYCSSSGTTLHATLGLIVSASGLSGRADSHRAIVQNGHLSGIKPPCKLG